MQSTSIRKVMSNLTSKPLPKPSICERNEMRTRTSNPMSEPQRKPSTSVRKMTRNPTSNLTRKPPPKPSMSVRKEMPSNQMQFDKHGVRIVGPAIDQNCSVQTVSEAIANQKKRVLTNERRSYPTSNPMKESRWKPSTRVRKQTRNPTSNLMREPPGKTSTSVKRETCNPTSNLTHELQ